MSSFGNPRSPDEAEHEYYLVPASMKLRYAPQYADIRLNDLTDALLAEYSLRKKGVKYKVYDKNGNRIPRWKDP